MFSAAALAFVVPIVVVFVFVVAVFGLWL